jgi:hypothetical protein
MRGCEQKMRLFEVPQDMGEAWDEIENFDSDDLWSTKVVSHPPMLQTLAARCKRLLHVGRPSQAARLLVDDTCTYLHLTARVHRRLYSSSDRMTQCRCTCGLARITRGCLTPRMKR